MAVPNASLHARVEMGVEIQLRELESRYRSALSATVVAKAKYLAIAGEPCVTAAAINRAKFLWQQVNARKRTIAVQMGELEILEDAAELRPPSAQNSLLRHQRKPAPADPCTFQHRLILEHPRYTGS